MTRKLPLVLTLVAVLIAVGALVLSAQGRAAILHAVIWLRGAGAPGAALFAAAYLLSVLAFVPAAWSAAFAGYLYGVQLGLAISLPATLAGAVLAFVLGRWVARDTVAAFAERRPRLRAVDAAIGKGGYRLVVLLRLCMPHNLLNYGLAASRLSLRSFTLGTALGGWPITILCCTAGSLAASAEEVLRAKKRLGSWPVVLTVLGGLAALAAFAWLVRAARRELERQVPAVRESARPSA